MSKVKMIACCDPFGNIGFKNTLPFNLPEELAMFKGYTMGHNVLMGRRTFESILAHRAKPQVLLPGRDCFILSGVQPAGYVPRVKNAQFVSSWMDAYPDKPTVDLWIIGGATLYKQFMPMVDEMRLSITNDVLKEADTGIELQDIYKHLTPVSKTIHAGFDHYKFVKRSR